MKIQYRKSWRVTSAQKAWAATVAASATKKLNFLEAFVGVEALTCIILEKVGKAPPSELQIHRKPTHQFLK